jgi:hypothetical protein
MEFWKRLALAALVIVIDLIAFALPLTAIAIAYVLLARPPRFLNWVLLLYREPGSKPGLSNRGQAH